MSLWFIWDGHFHAIHNFSCLLPPKHLISSEISKICISLGRRYIGKFFEFFNFLHSFHTKLAKNDPQWWILPKKSVRLAQNGQFWSFCRFSPIISHNSLSFSTFPILFTPNWLKMTHNAKFCQKSGLDWLQMVVHWDIYIFISFACSIPLFGLILTRSEKWALFWRFHAEILISCWDIYVFVSFDHSIPLFGLISTGLEKWALLWRFHAEILISCWDIYVFVNFYHSIPLFGLISTGSEKWALFWRFCAEILISCWDIYVFVSFDHSIPLFGLISTGSEKRALFWRFCAEILILCWDIYVFVSFDHSIPLFGLILTGLEKQALFWRFHAEILISCWDIYVFVSFDHSIPLFGLISTDSSPVLKVLCRSVDIPLRYLSQPELDLNLAWT